jgi:hypothetical protein
MPMSPVMQAAEAERDLARREVGEVVGGAHHVGGDVGGQRGDAERDQRDEEHDGILEAREQHRPGSQMVSP